MDSKKKSIIGIICSVVGLVFFNIILGPIAIYLGIKSKKDGYKKSGILSIVLGIIAILLFVSIPTLKFVFDTSQPIFVMVSATMSHDILNGAICNAQIPDTPNKAIKFDEYWKYCGDYYKDFNISKGNYESFSNPNGFNIGDITIIKNVDVDSLEVGDIILFTPLDESYAARQGLVIHRIIRKWQNENGKWYFQTKGDHNAQSVDFFENNIPEENINGKVIVIIPKIGFLKILYQNIFRF